MFKRITPQTIADWGERIYIRFLELTKRFTSTQIMALLAIIVGVLAGLGTCLFELLLYGIKAGLTHWFPVEQSHFLFLFYPVIGIILASLFVKYVVKDNISEGVTRVLYAMSRKNSYIASHNCWTSVVGGATTIGFGGSVGPEAPIVLTGSAIGSNLGQLFHLERKRLMLLVGCGASAAVAGIFKAPIAGLVFTIEILMVDLTMASLLPILISSVTATCFSYLFTGEASMFNFHTDDIFQLDRLPATILLGVGCGFVSIYFMRTMSWCEDGYARLAKRPYVKLLMGGLTLSTLIFLFPSLYGEGYDTLAVFIEGKTETDWDTVMQESLFAGKGEYLVLYVALVVITKVFATSATNGAGGCGGTFAPSLFIGGSFGFLFARLWNQYELGVYVPEKNFTLYGMAGVMAAVMHAPLTGIFLIAELTGGYSLFIPLIVVAVSAYLTISIFVSHSIYALRLAREGKLLTHHTDHSVLTLMSMDSIIERDYTSVRPDMEMGKLVLAISSNRHNYLPVTDDNDNLLGEIDLTKVRNVIFRTELYHRFTVRQLMTLPPATLAATDSMERVMRTFDKTGADYLPVLSVEGHLVGYISRTRMYTMYRQVIRDYSTE